MGFEVLATGYDNQADAVSEDGMKATINAVTPKAYMRQFPIKNRVVTGVLEGSAEGKVFRGGFASTGWFMVEIEGQRGYFMHEEIAIEGYSVKREEEPTTGRTVYRLLVISPNGVEVHNGQELEGAEEADRRGEPQSIPQQIGEMIGNVTKRGNANSKSKQNEPAPTDTVVVQGDKLTVTEPRTK